MTTLSSAAPDAAAARPAIDLPAYFERIGYPGPAEPTEAVLAATFGLSFPPGTRFHYRVPSA